MEVAEQRGLLPIGGLSKWLGVSEATIHRLRNRAEDPLPSLKVGHSTRFAPEQVEEWLARQKDAKNGRWDLP